MGLEWWFNGNIVQSLSIFKTIPDRIRAAGYHNLFIYIYITISINNMYKQGPVECHQRMDVLALDGHVMQVTWAGMHSKGFLRMQFALKKTFKKFKTGVGLTHSSWVTMTKAVLLQQFWNMTQVADSLSSSSRRQCLLRNAWVSDKYYITVTET